MTVVESGSSLGTYLSCPRKYYYRYVQRLDSGSYSSPLVIGSIIHGVAEDTHKGDLTATACTKVIEEFGNKLKETDDKLLPRFINDVRYATRVGKAWRAYWCHPDNTNDLRSGNLDFIAVEREWRFNVNLNADLAGKSDGYLFHNQLKKHFLYELKTAADRDREGYIHGLQQNAQINNNLLSLKGDKLPCDGVLYDIIWKPGLRIKVNETEDQLVDRIIDTICENPEKYFQRVLIFRSGEKLDHHITDLRQQMDSLLASHKSQSWYRNTGSCKLYNTQCQYFEMCVDNNGDMEESFTKRERKLGELSPAIQEETAWPKPDFTNIPGN